MKIASLSIRGVPGVADVDASFRTTAGTIARTVAITGPSGSGKTRLLEAITVGKEAVAPYDMAPSGDEWISARAASSKIALHWWLDASERDDAALADAVTPTEVVFVRGRRPATSADPGLVEILRRYAHDDAWGKVDYYPSDRALPRMSSVVGDIEVDQLQRRLSRSSSKYGALQRFAVDAFHGTAQPFDELCDLFSRLSSGRRIVGVDATRRLELDTATGDVVHLEQLSDADRMAFLFAATATMIRLNRSVVLLDTPELHQRPGEAARILGELVARFPDCQWVVATSDPDVLAMMDVVVQVGGKREHELLAAHG